MVDVGVQKLGTLTGAQHTILVAESLTRAVPVFIFNRFCDKKLFDPNEGNSITYTKFTALSAVTTALNEGEDSGTAQTISSATASLTPARYGAHQYISWDLAKRGIFDVASEYAPRMGEQAFLSADTLTRNVLNSGGTAQYVGQTARASITSSDIFTEAELLKGLSTLWTNKARPLPELGNKYAMIIHPHVAKDVKVDPGLRAIWENVGVRGPANELYGDAMGSAHGVMFFVTDQVYINLTGGSGSTVDVYYNFLIGRESYMTAGLAGELLEYWEGGTGNRAPINLKIYDFEDYPPYGQKMSIAWLIDHSAVVLDSNWIIRFECAASMGGA